MSLATRCKACGTAFRVVQDQLRVSEGWVRCGRCDEVFNAIEGLFDTERASVPEWEPTVPIDLMDSAPGPLAAPELAANDERVPDPHVVERIDEQLHGHRRADMADVDNRDRHEFEDAQLDPDMWSDYELQPVDAALDPADATDAMVAPEFTPSLPAVVHDDDEVIAPEFVRSAERAARWQRPLVRAGLSLVALLLLGGLALQLAHQQRDYVAARWPDSVPLLAQWCQQVECRIGPLHRIEDIAVESSALTRLTSPDAFRLTVALRNRGELAVALPSVELSLNDAAGLLIARRALAPGDFRATRVSLAAGADTELALLLAANDPRVSGYTIEIFYP
jgi:predicted Zn finger-like uncharacterized protein